MIRFLVGLILGGAVAAVGLGAVAVLNPLPDGPVSRMDAPRTAPAAPEAPAASDTDASTAPAAPETGGSGAPAAPAQESAAAPAALTAPMAADGGSDSGPSIGGAASLSAPEAPSIGAPSLGGGESTGLSANTDSTPIRTASAPQVSAGDTGAAPSVNTESAGVPEIGGVATDDSAAELVPGEALSTNAVPFDGDTSKPMMAIILIDEGGAADLRSGLGVLEAPVTFGVSADLRDAADVARQYRAAGFEVVAVIPGDGALGLTENLPPEAVTPLLARVLQAVPNATAVLDPIGGPLPNDRALAEELLDGLRITGHGLLTHRGSALNTVPLIADEKGVFSEVIYRIIDSEPGSANIALSLERAVLDATRDGSVLVVGHLRPDTVTTLFSWLLGSGPRDVTIAPVSVVLQ
ncbi:divergent polysaccharide deacetylase family protein [Oceanibium sediminis]|uniref:divergent polysaccharide deacetylase family protein n=1 Tax=Oceanibium sediminis TaxID=2026339 RepID=UPI00130064C6|nr:divergent polysaccharide deacetylase family protein [Oceanibium sediminis]